MTPPTVYALDIETTGLDPERNKIIEIACISSEGDEFHATMPPDFANDEIWSAEAREMHRRRMSGWLPQYDLVEKALLQLADWLPENPTLIGSNLRAFDCRFIEHASVNALFDTHWKTPHCVIELASIAFPFAGKLAGLDDIAKALKVSVIEERRHSAMYDCVLTLACYDKIMRRAHPPKPAFDLSEMLVSQASYGADTLDTAARLAAHDLIQMKSGIDIGLRESIDTAADHGRAIGFAQGHDHARRKIEEMFHEFIEQLKRDAKSLAAG